VVLPAQHWRNSLLTIAVMGLAAMSVPAAGDELILRKVGERSAPLGPQMPGADMAQPRALTIRRPVGTYLCPDPRDITKHCAQLRPSYNTVRLGTGAPVAPLGSGWLSPVRVPDVDYNQPPAPGLNYNRSALDRGSFGLPPLHYVPVILMHRRSGSAALPFPILPSLHR